MPPWDVCSNSGLTQDKCECLDCFPWIHRFKFICIDAKNIDDVISTLEGQVELFKTLKEGGYQIEEPHDDYMHIIPPYKVGYYWARCKKCGIIYEEQEGNDQRLCEKCGEDE
ncbi:MAG: hypothetical protein RTV72_09745 [Candidatus Thorarchaeota archaeon]